MTNPFDTLKGLDNIYDLDDDEINALNGLGSKLKKAVKKLARPDKILKSTVKEIERSGKKVVAEVKRNPVAAGVVVLAASAMLSPTVGAALKAGLATAGKAVVAGAGKVAVTAGKVASVVGKTAVAAGKTLFTAKNAASVVKLGATVAQAKMQSATAEAQVAAQISQSAINIREAIDNKTPEFTQMVNTLKARGYTDEQIQQVWLNSQAYVDTTKQAVAQQYQPQFYQDYVQQGYAPPQATQLSYEKAAVMGEEVANIMRDENGYKTPLVLGLGALGLLAILSNR